MGPAVSRKEAVGPLELSAPDAMYIRMSLNSLDLEDVPNSEKWWKDDPSIKVGSCKFCGEETPGQCTQLVGPEKIHGIWICDEHSRPGAWVRICQDCAKEEEDERAGIMGVPPDDV